MYSFRLNIKNMKTKIISAFPGTGKSFYHKNHPETTLDSDSSLFSWIYDTDGDKVLDVNNKPIRNNQFPQNYIEHIKSNIGKYEYIFVSSHKEVREALVDNCLLFYLIYPDYNDKEIYIERYKQRGSSDDFIKLIENNWEEWIEELEDQESCFIRQLPKNTTISHLLKYFND